MWGEGGGVGKEEEEKKNRDCILKPKNLFNSQAASGSQVRQNGEERVQLRILDNAIMKEYWCSRKQLALKKRPKTCPMASLNPEGCKCSAAKYHRLMKAGAGPCQGTALGTDLAPAHPVLPPHCPAGARAHHCSPTTPTKPLSFSLLDLASSSTAFSS